MIKSFLIFFLVFLSTYQFPAQIPTIKNAEKQIMRQYDWIEYHDVGRLTNMDSLYKMVSRSKQIDFRSGELRGLILLQRNALRTGNYDLSEKYGDEAEKLAHKENSNYSLSLIQLNRACIAIDLGLYPEAKSILKKTAYVEKINNKADRDIYLSNAYMLYAGIYSRIGAKDSMLSYTKKSLDVIESTPLHNLTDYQKVRYYYLKIFQLMNMGISYAYHPKKTRYDLAESYFQKALRYSVTHPQYFKLCDIEVYESVSAFYNTKKDYEKSIEYSKKVLELERIKKKPEERLAAYEGIKNAYHELGNDSEELKYLKLYTNLSDSIKNAQKIAVINQSRKKIDTYKDVYHKNRLNIALTATGSIFLIIIASWYHHKRSEQKSHKKYNELIHKLQNKSTENYDISEIKIQTPSNISSETEKKLLKKLEAFESSGKFLKKGITITYLSNLLSTNPKYLSEVIKNNKSQNFNTYINRLRINYIVNNLYNDAKYRDYKISYLAEECGYASTQVFVMAFKKEHGVAPSYFIDQLNNNS